MADIFISFATTDTDRVGPFRRALIDRGLSVFWSNDIVKGAPDYHAVIKREIKVATVVVVFWTHQSVKSHPVTQECAQAEQDKKLFQVLLDEFEPIDFPFEVNYRAQKAMLQGWKGDFKNCEWTSLVDAIAKKTGKPRVSPEPKSTMEPKGPPPAPRVARSRRPTPQSDPPTVGDLTKRLTALSGPVTSKSVEHGVGWIEWYLARDGKQHGPISHLEMRKVVEGGYLKHPYALSSGVIVSH